MQNNLFLNEALMPWNIHDGSFLSLSLRPSPSSELWGQKAANITWREYFSEIRRQREEYRVDENSIAHISVFGVLLNKVVPRIVAWYGGTDYDEILSEINDAESDPHVRGIMLHIDSPGGHAVGNDRVASRISACAKPVFAYTDGYCCSAAYAIAAGARHICASADATVGCIGTILPMLDISGLWEQMGIKPDYITNKDGDLKAASFPPSRTPEQRASLQSEIEQLYSLFSGHVLGNRKIEAGAMRGQCFVGAAAASKNLCDTICEYTQAYSALVKFSNL